MRFFSSYIERDPSMTKTLRVTYERKLSKLFRRFNKEALETLPRYRFNEATRINFPDLTEALLMLAEAVIKKPSKPLLQSMVEEAMKAGQRRASAQLRRVSITATIGQDIVVDQRVKDTLFARETSLFDGLTDDMVKNIQTQLSDGILKGEDMRRLAKRVSEQTGIASKRARTIARTETMYAFNTASREEFQRYGVEMVEWVAAMDERTCPKCGPLHGKKFRIGEAPDCPLHPNCRCVLIPFIEEEI